jgi:TetR/AcrR family transcriptional repressor of nem operon
MARPRQFNTDEALEQAMQVFWAKGYEATSLNDLIGAMGISKSSLYDTFGSKHELFLATIDRYNETVSSCSVSRAIDAAPSPRAGIECVFRGVVDCMTKDGDKRGCYVSNCASEVAWHDEAAAGRIAEGIECMETSFHRAVRQGQQRGEIGKDKDARALARFLTGALNGLLVMAKAHSNPRALQDMVRVTLDTLD